MPTSGSPLQVDGVVSPSCGSVESRDDSVLFQLPGLPEQLVVMVACFVLSHQLPTDWFRTREAWQMTEGNAKLIVVQSILMLLCILRIIGSLDWLLRMFRADLWIFMLPSLALLSTLWSDSPDETLRQSINLGIATLFGTYLVLRFALGEILQLLANVFVVSAVINMVFVVWFPKYGIYDGRWTGVFNNKNALAFMALIAIPVLILAARSGAPLRLLYYTAAVIFGGLLIGSASKTMLIGTVGTLGLMVVYTTFRGRKTSRGAAYVTLLAAFGIVVVLSFRNITAITQLLDKDVTFTGRIPLWELLVPIALERPMVGYGFGAAFGGYFSPVHEVWVIEGWRPSHAHNELLNIALQLGLLGVVTYVALIVGGVKRAVAMVGLVPNAVGLWPVTFLTATLLVSVTESGMTHAPLGWLLLVVANLSTGFFTSEIAESS